jgi:hypothetical protein
MVMNASAKIELYKTVDFEIEAYQEVDPEAFIEDYMNCLSARTVIYILINRPLQAAFFQPTTSSLWIN